MEIVNCHIHTFTHEHVPDGFVNPVLAYLLRIGWLRRRLLKFVHRTDRGRRLRIARLAEVLEVSHKKSQQEVFETVAGFYPENTRFVVLPMDMELIGRGKVKRSIAEQHDDLRKLRSLYSGVLPFAAADPRREDVFDTTKRRLEQEGFCGIKLYPPLGYHPNDRALWPLYAYAEEHDVPVVTHCSRPAGVTYKGKVTERMRTDPVTGDDLGNDLGELLTRYTDPDAYRPILEKHPRLRICLAHFGGSGDWKQYIDHPWDPATDPAKMSWLAKIADLLRKGTYPNLWTDISYTVFADDEWVYMLKVLLEDDRIRGRALFGSDFYVVASAKLEERRRAVRVRAVLGEKVFGEIADRNPKAFLGRRCFPDG